MHQTHVWHSLAAEGAGYACMRCHVCTCHSPKAAAEPCPDAPEPHDSGSEDER